MTPVRTAVLTGKASSVAFTLPDRGELVIGRDPEVELPVDDASLSRRHALLRLTPSGMTIEDLSSKNGTRIGARRASPKSPLVLAMGAVAELGGVMLTVVERSEARAARRASRKDAAHELVVTASLAPLLDLVARIAPTDLPVLMLGETGVGKDVFAERIHQLSRRASRAFVRVNAAALAETLFESELFGHEQGAFTGALRGRAGLLETADGGTVFFDEVGELPPAIQVKLLRVIDDRRITRVGGTTMKRVDVRFVAATNRDLAAEVASGSFRKDLYHRLRGVVVEVPPLRERRADIPLLAAAFLERVAPHKKLGDDALRALAKSPFWGNVRELRNVVERSALLARAKKLSAADIVWDERAAAPLEQEGGRGASPETKQIQTALARCKGNQTAAAKLLGISRRTLVYKLSALDLPRPRSRARPGSRRT
jgi:transcriptional regulator with PAS, ATPase and Fis domain